MSSFLSSLLDCLTGGSSSSPQQSYRSYSSIPKSGYPISANEKLDLEISQTAENIVQAFITAPTAGPALDQQVKNFVSASSVGWIEYLAKAVLTKLTDILNAGAEVNWGGALSNAFKRATTEAWQFAKEHPVYTTLIALGVLVVLAPWVLEALGFAALGPEEGTFAAWWQSTYGGYVTKDSWFAFFQRLGMQWGKLKKFSGAEAPVERKMEQ